MNNISIISINLIIVLSVVLLVGYLIGRKSRLHEINKFNSKSIREKEKVKNETYTDNASLVKEAKSDNSQVE